MFQQLTFVDYLVYDTVDKNGNPKIIFSCPVNRDQPELTCGYGRIEYKLTLDDFVPNQKQYNIARNILNRRDDPQSGGDTGFSYLRKGVYEHQYDPETTKRPRQRGNQWKQWRSIKTHQN